MVRPETADEQTVRLLSHTDSDLVRVLVVDDDPSVLGFLSKVLENQGFEVGRAMDLRAAVGLLEVYGYDLVLTDLSLPDGTGLEVIQTARVIDSRTVCILITGHATMESAIEAIHAEVYDFIPKPFDIKHLLAIVKRGLEKRSLEIENHRLMEELHQERELLQSRVDEATRDLQIKLREVEDLNNEITVLFEIVRDMRGDLRMSDSLDRLIDYLRRAIQFDSAFWLVVDSADRVLSCREWEGKPRRELDLKDLPAAEAAEFRRILADPLLRDDRAEAVARWISMTLKTEIDPDACALAPFKTSADLQGFVGLLRDRPFGPEHPRLLALAVSLLTTLWEENAVLQRGSQMASIGELTAEVAHDLRNGLSAFRHIANHLFDQVDLSNPKNQEYRDVLLENLTLTDDLIAELLSFGGPEEDFGRTTPIRPLFERILKISGKSLERKGVQVSVDLRQDDLVAFGSMKDLSESLLNVVVNSIQAMQQGGELRLSAESVERPRHQEDPESTARFVRISIADTGVGIPKENLKRVFGRYFTTKKEGTGLGLSRLQRVARKCLGKVEIESEVGKGTTVILLLPEV